MTKQENLTYEYIISYILRSSRQCDVDRVVKKRLSEHVILSLDLGFETGLTVERGKQRE